jgi:hypothetical protein
MRKLLFINLVVALGIANANILVFQAVLTEKEFNQQDSSPCVIGDSSCKIGLLPSKTVLDPGGNETSYDASSPIYTVAQIRLAVGNDFILGLDINETSAIQTLSKVEILINGVLTDSYSADPAVFVPSTVGGGNGTGYADYILTNVTSLDGRADDATVRFHLVMPSVNSGREQLFLIPNGGGGGSLVPEPSTWALMATGGLAMLLGCRRRRLRTHAPTDARTE